MATVVRLEEGDIGAEDIYGIPFSFMGYGATAAPSICDLDHGSQIRQPSSRVTQGRTDET